MCIQKTLILNRRYTVTKKNGGLVPPLLDKRQKYVYVPCGQCYICKKKKAREWRMRITEDIKENPNCKIITLTFNTESLIKLKKRCGKVTGYNLDNEICRQAVKLWRERWRKKYGRSPRHWLITELGHGETEHVHMHGIIWEDSRYKLEDKLLNEVEKTWQYGYVGKGKKDWQTGEWINYVNAKTANYFTKYVNKIDEQHKEYKQIILTSPGIGSAYIKSNKARDNIYIGKKTKQTYQVEEGGVLPMPEYLRRKLYTDEQRERLTSNYLDENIIYIAGVPYKGDMHNAEINKIYKNEQEKNARLGYGDGRKNYERIRNENARRRKKQKERLGEDEQNWVNEQRSYAGNLTEAWYEKMKKEASTE